MEMEYNRPYARGEKEKLEADYNTGVVQVVANQ
jgi:hypothetical protein